METVGTILQQAIELERRARAFYDKSAVDIKDPVVKSVLHALSHDEEIHEVIIRRFYEALEHGKGWPAVDTDLPVPKSTIENVGRIIKEAIGVIGSDSSFFSVYEKARELELKSRDYYKSQADMVDDRDAKEFFRFLMDLEDAHLQALDMLVEATRRVS